ncbi:glycosyltransferase, partial [Gemmatimonadota bacterium]
DLPQLYPAMDALALTSFDEGTPVAVLEALAAGTPVAARGVGGVAEVLEGMELATLIEEATPEAVAAGLLEVLEKERGAETLAAAQRRVVERYSVERLAADMAALYAEELKMAGMGAG